MKLLDFIRSRLLKTVLIVGMISMATLFGVMERHSVFSHAVFHTLYVFPLTRPAVLRLYTWSLRNFGNGDQPEAIDLFLLKRLNDCHGSREERAILMQKIRQAPGRWGLQIVKLYECEQKAVISCLIPILDGLSGWDAINALVLIEYMRVEGDLCKGWLEHEGERIDDSDTALIERAKGYFKAWWRDGESTWPESRQSDPLAGSKFKIDGIP